MKRSMTRSEEHGALADAAFPAGCMQWCASRNWQVVSSNSLSSSLDDRFNAQHDVAPKMWRENTAALVKSRCPQPDDRNELIEFSVQPVDIVVMESGDGSSPFIAFGIIVGHEPAPHCVCRPAGMFCRYMFYNRVTSDDSTPK